MAGYAKIWTSIWNDKWYKSLSCLQRGLWLQLIAYAKFAGDTGAINQRNFAELSGIFGLDDSTTAKNLRKFAEVGKITLETDEYGITIKIANYEEYQRLIKPEEVRVRAKSPRKIPEKSPLTEQNQTEPDRTEQNIREDMSPDKSGSPRLQKFYQAVIQIDYSKYKDLGLSKVDYDFEIKKMAGWIEQNPRKGNKSNYGRFIHNWLIRRIEDGKQSKRGGREVDTFPD